MSPDSAGRWCHYFQASISGNGRWTWSSESATRRPYVTLVIKSFKTPLTSMEVISTWSSSKNFEKTVWRARSIRTSSSLCMLRCIWTLMTCYGRDQKCDKVRRAYGQSSRGSSIGLQDKSHLSACEPDLIYGTKKPHDPRHEWFASLTLWFCFYSQALDQYPSELKIGISQALTAQYSL
jgi:hypothetical protein